MAAVFTVTLNACNDGGTKVTITELPPGTPCPTGGFEIQVGTRPPQTLCNGTNGSNGTNGTSGADGFTTLVTQSTLPVGDARCPSGGVLVQAGPDDGADGGTARDSTLSPGEVRSSSVVCTGDSRPRPGSTTPPPGTEGTDQLIANGGDADGGTAGTGGTIQLTNASLSRGGHLKAFKTGHVDPSFQSPTAPSFAPGENPAIVTSDTSVTLQTSATTTGLDAGVLFVFGTQLYVSTGPTTPGTVASSLSVAANVTLSLPTLGTGNTLTLARSCRNAGTITAERIGLSCVDFVGESGSHLTARQRVTGGPAAGGSVDLITEGTLLNAGAVDVAGSNGTRGGAGGQVRMSAGGLVVNTGQIVATGGSATDDAGGAGGTVQLTGFGGVWNSGAIDASGGAAGTPVDTTPRGGTAGTIVLQSTDGTVRNAAALRLNGGAATCSACTGGTAGQLTLQGVSIVLASALSLRGGVGDVGGNGGQVWIETHSGDSWWRPARTVLMSGTVDVSGAPSSSPAPDTRRGGSAGSIRATLSGGEAGAELVLLGYANFVVNGGNGSHGGAAGSIGLANDLGESNLAGLMGAVVNTVDLKAHGGTGGVAAQDSGGRGGTVTLATQPRNSDPSAVWEIVDNAGLIDVGGGSGALGGEGGQVSMDGKFEVRSRGAIDGRSGNGSHSPSGGNVQFTSIGPVTIDGAIDVSSTGSGGAGGLFAAWGETVTVKAPLKARGGDGVGEATGGTGGSVKLTTRGGEPTFDVMKPAGLSVKGGNGTPSGAPGFIIVNGFDTTYEWDH